MIKNLIARITGRRTREAWARDEALAQARRDATEAWYFELLQASHR